MSRQHRKQPKKGKKKMSGKMTQAKFDLMKKRAQGLMSNSIAPTVLPGVKMDDLRDIKCKCGGDIFVQTFAVKFASPLQTRNNVPTMIQIPMGYTCGTCGELNNFVDPMAPAASVHEENKGEDIGISVEEKVKSGEALG